MRLPCEVNYPFVLPDECRIQFPCLFLQKIYPMNFISDELDEYAVNHTSEESELLYRLNRETNLRVLQPRMLSGHFQGRLLSMFSKMIRPEMILEIGTYTGYSTLCFLEGLSDNGKIITIDINHELEDMAQKYFDESGRGEHIDFRIGNAMEIVPNLTEQFDLVFIDADKENYINYYNLIFDKVVSGGYIIADNVLWSGKVLDTPEKMDLDTKILTEFNAMVQSDERVENILLPVRDGLMVARKR
jgi:caffeoyl-CoA O-methyltransferase